MDENALAVSQYNTQASWAVAIVLIQKMVITVHFVYKGK